MPRDGSGIYSLPSGNPVVDGTTIEAAWANDTMNDLGNEITGSLPRNGAAPMSGALAMGNNKITGVGEGTAAADAVTKSQLDLAAKLAVEQTWTAQQTPMNGALTAGATVNWNGDTNGQIVSLTLNQATTMAAPTNINEHACYVIRITNDSTPRTVTWNAAYRFPGGVDHVMTATANAVDILTFVGGSGNILYCVGQAKGLA